MNSNTQVLVDLQSLEFSSKEPKSKRRRMETLRKSVGHTLLGKYEARKKLYGGRSIVPIHGKCCSGCHVAQSQQARSRAYDQILECEYCGRLLYDPVKREPLKIIII